MRRYTLQILVLVGCFFMAVTPLRAQTPSPEALAAAKELMDTTKMTDQLKAILPAIVQAMKPAIVQGRSNIEKDYDALAPAMIEVFQARLSEFVDSAAAIYANNFSAEELREITAFYKTPVGQKALQKMPAIAQQSMAMGQQFGQSLAGEVRAKAIEQLRAKGDQL